MNLSEQERIAELRKIVSEDPGNNKFVELASLLMRIPEKRKEAREICFRGITKNPNNLKGRMILARAFYLDGMHGFCARELLEIKKSARLKTLDRLLSALGESIKTKNIGEEEKQTSIVSEQRKESGKVIAEMDLDIDFLEALDSLDDEEKTNE